MDIQKMTQVAKEDIIEEIPVQQLRPNPYQPRIYFDEEALEELAKSIEQSGVFQPIIVRKSQIKGYEIIAGERRYRASKRAGKTSIPAIVRTVSDEEMMQIAVLENLQREDLSPLEEARSYQQLMEHLHLTQQEVADRLGKSRPYIANYLRLLHLPEVLKEKVNQGELSVGQARTLLGVENPDEQIRLAKKIQMEQLSVREVERLVAEKSPKKKQRKKQKPLLYQEIERQLQDKFGTMVTVKGEEKGNIQIQFLSPDDLTHILDVLDIHID